MRKIISLLLLSFLMPCAFAEIPWYEPHHSQLSLQLRIPFGAMRDSTTPRIGLAIDRTVNPTTPTTWNPLVSPRTVSVLALEFTLSQSTNIHFSGVPLLNANGEARSVWRNPWLWVGIGAGVLIASCATDNFPCDSNNGSNGGGSGGGGY